MFKGEIAARKKNPVNYNIQYFEYIYRVHKYTQKEGRSWAQVSVYPGHCRVVVYNIHFTHCYSRVTLPLSSMCVYECEKFVPPAVAMCLPKNVRNPRKKTRQKKKCTNKPLSVFYSKSFF